MAGCTASLILQLSPLISDSGFYLLRSIRICATKICHYDWFSKQADWPTVEQNEVKRESKTEHVGVRKGGV